MELTTPIDRLRAVACDWASVLFIHPLKQLTSRCFTQSDPFSFHGAANIALLHFRFHLSLIALHCFTASSTKIMRAVCPSFHVSGRQQLVDHL